MRPGAFKRFQRVLDDVPQARALPVFARQEIMRTRQREQARLDRIVDRLRFGRRSQRLEDNRLHRCQRILHPVVEFVDEHLGLGQLLLVSRHIGEGGEMLDNLSGLVANGADEERGPEIMAILAPIADIRLAERFSIELLLDQRQRVGVVDARQHEVEALTEHLLAFISCQSEEAVIGEDDRIAISLGVGEHHCHPGLLRGDDEWAKVVMEILDLCFGVLLFVGLSKSLLT